MTNERKTGTVICGDCGAPMILRETSKFVHRNGSNRKFYGCSRWPDCKGVHGAHPDGRPLGVPGNSETKGARIKAHDALRELCEIRGWVGSSSQKRGAYVWLGRKLGIPEDQIQGKCHIAMFDISTCNRVISICAEAMIRSKAPSNLVL